ncbi:unnamed protein product, partial [Closterium sp. NIES-53]
MATISAHTLTARNPAALLGQTESMTSSNAIPSFSGLRAAAPVKAAAKAACARNCKCSRHSVVRAAAASANNDAEASSQTLFASVTQAAPAPAAENSLLVPGIIGAGVVGGAALALLTNKSAAPVAAAPAAAASSAPVAHARRAAAPALATMAATFPNAMQEETFMHAVAEELRNLGFRRDNCIALVNTCRDEVCRPIVNLIDREFGLSFNIAGLGGLVICGKTGFKAAMSHSPEFPCEKDGKPRERCNACGALIAIKGDIKAGGPVVEDPDNAEYVELKKKVIARVKPSGPDGPSLVQVTKAALQAITDDLEHLISLTVDPATADYAVITGVQIHSGNQ